MHKNIKLYKHFLYKKKNDLLILVIIVIVFSIIFSLGDVDLGYSGYGVILCLAFVVIIYGIEFYKYAKRYRQLNLLREQELYNLSEFPNAYELIDKSYQQIINDLYSELQKQNIQFNDLSIEMVDYYTMWAHQIKTPIAAMRILIQGNQEHRDRLETDQELLKDLENELFKIEQYVDMVLSYLRINSNTTDYVFEKISLDKIVKEAVKKYSKLFISKKIKLNLESITLEVVTDEKWITFVIEQIISNALKYTNEGSVDIYIKDDTVLIIEDTGIGIAQEDLPRVCEKGFTGYNGRTDKKSTGIGLYLCKKILTKLGYDIKLESQVGIGTRVLIDLNQEELYME